MKSPFDSIHRLLRAHRLGQALKHLLGNGKRVRAPFSADLNHAWYLIGDIRFRQRRFSEALDSFKKSLRHWPKDIQAMMAIANCYSNLARPKWTAFYLERAIKLDPRNSQLLYNLGNAYYDLNRYKKAIGAYKKALQFCDSNLALLCKRNLSLATDWRNGVRDTS